MTSQGAEALPRAVAWLGYGGLLPFVALAGVSLISQFSGQASAQTVLVWHAALITYGAVILSFVGALHWSFAMTLPDLTVHQRTASFVWSIVPALVAWIALLVAPVAGTALLLAGFAAHYWRDRKLAAHAGLPAWYLPMRWRLTGVACLCLLLAVLPQMLRD